MSDRMSPRHGLAVALLATAVLLPFDAAAQSGRIVCWKDKSGKVVGCGDKVPQEYLGNASQELDAHGVTRKTTESAEEVRRRREKEQESKRTKVEEDRRSIEQKRQDHALLATYANEKEIDLKRDRDLQALDLQLDQLTGALKNSTQRFNEVKARADAAEKAKKPLAPALKDELDRATQERQRLEASVQSKQKEKDDLRERFAEYRKRYTELKAEQTQSARR